jgi:hypothetical protein
LGFGEGVGDFRYVDRMDISFSTLIIDEMCHK